MSLSTIFLRLQLLHQKVENTAFDPQTTPQLLDEACALVDSAWRRYDEDDIASRNETVEDVNTGSLKYILLPFYAGDLYSRRNGNDRLLYAKKAIAFYEHFLQLCVRLELLERADEPQSDTPADLSSKRAAKVQRFKRQRELKAKLEQVLQRQERLAKRGADLDALEDEDELEREHLILLIKISVTQAQDNLDTLQQELPILEHGATLTQEQKDELQRQRDELQTQLRSMVENLIPRTKTREEVAAEIFRPSHRLPTYTIEEAGEVEMAIAEKMKAMAPPKKEDPDSDTEEGHNIKTLKARSWDDWKDDNPRGAGNTGRV